MGSYITLAGTVEGKVTIIGDTLLIQPGANIAGGVVACVDTVTDLRVDAQPIERCKDAGALMSLFAPLQGLSKGFEISQLAASGGLTGRLYSAIRITAVNRPIGLSRDDPATPVQSRSGGAPFSPGSMAALAAWLSTTVSLGWVSSSGQPFRYRIGARAAGTGAGVSRAGHLHLDGSPWRCWSAISPCAIGADHSPARDRGGICSILCSRSGMCWRSFLRRPVRPAADGADGCGGFRRLRWRPAWARARSAPLCRAEKEVQSTGKATRRPFSRLSYRIKTFLAGDRQLKTLCVLGVLAVNPFFCRKSQSGYTYSKSFTFSYERDLRMSRMKIVQGLLPLLLIIVLLNMLVVVAAQQGTETGTTYEVKESDETLTGIAERFEKPADCIQEANSLIANPVFRVGQRVFIPDDCSAFLDAGGGAAGTDLPTPTAETVTATPRVTNTQNPAHIDAIPAVIQDETYVVLAGDRLSKIAESYGATLACLVRANRIANPDLIYIGQQLSIPASCQGGGGGDITADSVSVGRTCQFDRYPGRAAPNGVYSIASGTRSVHRLRFRDFAAMPARIQPGHCE
jgi:LysM repeat protein